MQKTKPQAVRKEILSLSSCRNMESAKSYGALLSPYDTAGYNKGHGIGTVNIDGLYPIRW